MPIANPKRGRGRPKLPEGDAATAQIPVRVPQALYDFLQREADAQDRSLASLVRRLCETHQRSVEAGRRKSKRE